LKSKGFPNQNYMFGQIVGVLFMKLECI